jgi:hypothetical protein
MNRNATYAHRAPEAIPTRNEELKKQSKRIETTENEEYTDNSADRLSLSLKGSRNEESSGDAGKVGEKGAEMHQLEANARPRPLA